MISTTYNKIQKHFQNARLVEMTSKISKKDAYKYVDCSKHNGIKGAKAKCANFRALDCSKARSSHTTLVIGL